MLCNEKYVVVIGSMNILHSGLFTIIEEECLKSNMVPLFSDNDRDLWVNALSTHPVCYQQAIICLGHEDFFPLWLGTFLTLLRKTNGNVLIFTDSHELLNKRKMCLLRRVCEIEHVLDVSMPLSYISFLVEFYINKERNLPGKFKMSMRELSVIDGFLSGIDVVCHSSWLGITTKTLYQHRKNCANKLGVRNLKELLRL